MLCFGSWAVPFFVSTFSTLFSFIFLLFALPLSSCIFLWTTSWLSVFEAHQTYQGFVSWWWILWNYGHVFSWLLTRKQSRLHLGEHHKGLFLRYANDFLFIDKTCDPWSSAIFTRTRTLVVQILSVHEPSRMVLAHRFQTPLYVVILSSYLGSPCCFGSFY